MKGNANQPFLWIIAAAIGTLLALFILNTGETSTASQQEKRIAEVLSNIAGAGRVEVVLYTSAQSSGSFSSAEAVPTGALIVAEGAEDMAVRLNLIRAVRTLLGLPETAVDVFAMEVANQ